MKTKKFLPLKIIVLVWGILVLSNCVKDRNFDAPEIDCAENLQPTATFSDVKNLFDGATVQIQEDIVLEGYIVSSDRAGNFFNTLYFQNSPENATEGFQIDIDLRDSHLFYGLGQKVYFKLQGLYLGRTRGAFKLGGIFTAFGNLSVGRLPATVLQRHLFVACEEPALVRARETTIAALEDSMVHTLIQLNTLEFLEDEIDLPFALPQEETKRTLIDCNDNTLTLLNSGFSDFQANVLPRGNGSITGVLLKDNNTFQLVIRDTDDILFNDERCPEIIDEFTSEHLFISELADPDNNAGARFVELYNAGTAALPLKGWRLNRYTNASTTVSSSIDLSDFTIEAERTFVISPNASDFETIYGFPPDLGVGTNSPADSNGDDNLELVDPFGVVIDRFGVIGVDGSGTNHEFEDGRAFRRMEITRGNPLYTFSEWMIYNDTGDAGTINSPQNAPEDYSPGERGL
ncbi:DUF5689 domain-containing protein [Arenibacter sp. GZD96]|uniref:DUF5689 domain-containing protein n=1 Tax=Aurantibrevibacter litoralis TaxID=3106030 RepID=UPI002AFF05E6|nr:DUF5689 domain-containing protein [Arenibacter sp. GZD-96]MEA1785626.1 DUF5689 domain-containing protein [Arenibacter sp. GZD-96]